MPETLPGRDVSVSSDDDLTVIKAVSAYKHEAEMAKRGRMARNRVNRDAYQGRQDWSHKQKGQSTEFLPKTPVAVEQLVGFVKRALTQFGAWYDIELGRDSKSPLASHQIRSLMDAFLERMMVEENRERSFPVLLGDAIKAGSLESLIVLKVHGQMKGVPSLEEGDPLFESWRLRIDLIRNEDYFPDPSGAGLYEIQSTEIDLHEAIARAEAGIYEKSAVMAIKEDFEKDQTELEKRRAEAQNQNEEQKPGFRRRVIIDEFWGTILNTDGHVVERNVFAAVANGKHLIRRPKKNPFWHGKSPFVATPLIRIPFSVWHKALMDHAVELNLAQNELFNLIIDGGISSVWGIKQVRASDLENPDDYTDGIPQGASIVVKESLPHGAKAVETVSEGQVPADAMATFEMLSREFSAAALSNELKLGAFPKGEVKATEVIELSQSQAVTLDSIIGDIERDLIRPALELSWLTVLQNLDGASAEMVQSAVGTSATFDLLNMEPKERFRIFGRAGFRVHGLSATLSRVRDFQKFMALLQGVTANPVLMMAFFRKYSPQLVLNYLMKTLNINPETLIKSTEEQARVDQDIKEIMMFMQMASPQRGGTQNEGGAGMSAQDVGAPELPAEINQASNPLTGMTG